MLLAEPSTPGEPTPAASSFNPLALPEQAEAGDREQTCIVVSIDSTDSEAEAASSAGSSPVMEIEPALRYDDPRAIYRRYVAARDAWYKAQPRGSIRTNQQYRKSSGLPLRYDKASYAWCLDWKQMGRHCRTEGGPREWVKEEMMAYLDWTKAEEDRIEAQVAAQMEGNPFSNRRGMDDIWEAAAADGEAQQAFFSSR
jgi:hypothetical protein